MHRANWRFVGLLLLLVLLAGCASANQATPGSSVQTSATTNASGLPSDANPVLAGSVTPSPTDTPTSTPTPTDTPTDTSPAPVVQSPAEPPVSHPTAPPISHPTAPAPPPTTTNPPAGGSSSESQLQQQLFQQINQDRAAQGLTAYTLNSTMSNGARQHDITMAGSCGMQHQCPGEPDPGQRMSNEGISWTRWGENIGYTSPNPTAWAGVQQIEQQMLAEQPPNDGHRQNLLSTAFHRVGIGIYIDVNSVVWVTEDFAN